MMAETIMQPILSFEKIFLKNHFAFDSGKHMPGNIPQPPHLTPTELSLLCHQMSIMISHAHFSWPSAQAVPEAGPSVSSTNWDCQIHSFFYVSTAVQSSSKETFPEGQSSRAP